MSLDATFTTQAKVGGRMAQRLVGVVPANKTRKSTIVGILRKYCGRDLAVIWLFESPKLSISKPPLGEGLEKRAQQMRVELWRSGCLERERTAEEIKRQPNGESPARHTSVCVLIPSYLA